MRFPHAVPLRPTLFLAALTAIVCSTAGAQIPSVAPLDPLGFAQLKHFAAHRVSSDNPDPNSNDDSKRPIPGETTVLAYPMDRFFNLNPSAS